MAYLNENDWMCVLKFDVSQAMSGLNEYRNIMRRLSSSANNKQNKKWASMEAKSTTEVMNSIRNVKTKGPIYDALSFAGNRLYQNVIRTWRAELKPHTYRYLNAIGISKIERIGDTMFIGVGDWRRLMAATSINEPPIQYTSWIKPKYLRSNKLEGITVDVFKRRRKRVKQKSSGYTASSGPLAGQNITGYWYFLEEGFYHYISKQFIHKPVFALQNMRHFSSIAYDKFDMQLRKLLKRQGGWAKWSN